ncbi:MAG TPA: anti-sigma factor [Jatrophihabitans sp.]|jgi:anti-sigma-K factor RskA|uniref:anti-sigma factor n=1 Tax=Jatrophihabitans sp. TaxID=1932789 RepID=UPI002EFAF75A
MTDELNVLAGAYALDALDDDEREVFEQHLRTCAECAQEVRELRMTASELSHLSEFGPPPQLRAAVLGAVAQSRPLPPLVEDPRGERGNVRPLRRTRSQALWQGLAAACALIAVAVSVWGYSEHRQAQRAASAGSSVVQSLLDAPDVRAATTAMKQGQGTLIYSRKERRLVLIGRGIPALPSNQTYQLWLMTDTGAPVSGGVFRPDQAGNVEVPASGNLDGVDQMGISIEPAGGSPQPTPSTVQVLKL